MANGTGKFMTLLLAAALSTAACDRPSASPTPAPSTTPPGQEAPELADQTELTAAVLGQDEGRDGYRQAVRREQRALDRALVAGLARVERRLGTEPAERAALLDARARLQADRRLVAASDERGWDELKAEIEHDLDDVLEGR